MESIHTIHTVELYENSLTMAAHIRCVNTGTVLLLQNATAAKLLQLDLRGKNK